MLLDALAHCQKKKKREREREKGEKTGLLVAIT